MSNEPKSTNFRTWVTGLSITISTIIGLFAFWRLSPGVTYIVALIATVILLISVWQAGKDH